ncbi:porin [Cupriavidus necator]|uniref:porin n=1 Tax=Cupriavidus necator TaxID=106590 RepID=UPI0038B2E559
MKSRYYAAALLSMTAPFAAAQSSVTLYGVADIGMEYLSHANAAGDKLIGVLLISAQITGVASPKPHAGFRAMPR